MRFLALALPFAVAASSSLPLPGFLFYPLDPQVGNVDEVSDDALSQRIRGKTALIVGGTDGIGRGTALAMASRGASVTVVGHSPQKAEQVVGKMSAIAKYPDEQKFNSFAVDLFTVKGTLNFTEALKSTGAMFDYVVLTVGTWPDAKEPQTSDGIDKVIALDVLSRYLVTRELLSNLKPGARVMSVLASTVRNPLPSVDTMKQIALGKKEKSFFTQVLGTAGAIGDSWMREMATRAAPNVSFLGTFPGLVADDLVAHSKTFPAWLRPLLDLGVKIIGMKPEECGRLHTTIISSPNPSKRPVTYFNTKLEGRQTYPIAYDSDFGAWVWTFLEETVAKHRQGNNQIAAKTDIII